MRIADLKDASAAAQRQAAQLLVNAFRENWPNAWPTLAAAIEEVQDALEPDKLCRAAFDESGSLLGWVGAIPNYDGNAWELHPIVVRPDLQRRGIGSALMQDIEDLVRRRGAYTMYLGTDDEAGMTTLSGVDLYEDLWKHVRDVRDLRGHPYAFYQKLGYTIVGVIPDANGPGKPDIYMAKRLR
jgi:aminoglycoside 6'-N-acetyltransferase I